MEEVEVESNNEEEVEVEENEEVEEVEVESNNEEEVEVEENEEVEEVEENEEDESVEEVEENEEDESVEEVEVEFIEKRLKPKNGKGRVLFLITDDDDRDIYERLPSGDPGEHVGKLVGKNNRPHFF